MVPVYIVNLDRSSGRLAFMQNQADRLGFSITRVAAVEGLRVPSGLQHYFRHIREGKDPIIDDTAIGCYASHLIALQKIAASGAPASLVLEDDVILPNDLNQVITELLNALPAKWDFVQLAKPPQRAYKPIKALRCGRSIVRYSKVPPGCHGYLISHAGALKFLNPEIERFWSVDIDTRRPWLFGLDSYGVVPVPILIEWGFQSTITPDGRAKRMPRRGLPRPTTFSWTNMPLHSPRSFTYYLRTLGLAWWLRCLAINRMKRTFLRTTKRHASPRNTSA